MTRMIVGLALLTLTTLAGASEMKSLTAVCAPYEKSYDVDSGTYVDIAREFCLISNDKKTFEVNLIDVLPDEKPITHIANLQSHVYVFGVTQIDALNDQITILAEDSNDRKSKLRVDVVGTLQDSTLVTKAKSMILDTYWNGDHLGTHTSAKFRNLKTFTDANYTAEFEPGTNVAKCLGILNEVIKTLVYGNAVVLSVKGPKLSMAASDALAQFMNDKQGPFAQACPVTITPTP